MPRPVNLPNQDRTSILNQRRAEPPGQRDSVISQLLTDIDNFGGVATTKNNEFNAKLLQIKNTVDALNAEAQVIADEIRYNNGAKYYSEEKLIDRHFELIDAGQ